jgi:hypothetical protein
LVEAKMNDTLIYGILAMLLMVTILHGAFIALDKIESRVKGFFVNKNRRQW